MTEEQKIQYKFLLADFQSIKNEIGRRSNLQKVVLTLTVSFYAWFIISTMQSPIDLNKIFLVWAVVVLAYIFYEREANEISRLALIINQRIAKLMSEELKVEPAKIIPSEVHDREYPTESISDFDTKLPRSYL